MSTLHERLRALIASRKLPKMEVDLATFKRLEALAGRIAQEDPTFDVDRHFEHAVYAAICAGLRASEQEAGVRYDENSGNRLPDPDPMPVFPLLAKDNRALTAIEAYYATCRDAGLWGKSAQVLKAIEEIVNWRNRWPELCHEPDYIHVPARRTP